MRPAHDSSLHPDLARRIIFHDVFGSAACVRVDTTDWVDYLHLGLLNIRWQIVNLLWERR